MVKPKRILFCFIIFLALVSCNEQKKQEIANVDNRPNIILIMSDDMGYSDIGCYGGLINTPVLDGLANNGLRYTQFYNTARCCPTRAALLTGVYQHQAGIGHMVYTTDWDFYSGDLSPNVVTIAEVLNQAGYATYMSGKWHVTPYKGEEEHPTKENWPLQRGFDKFFGTIHGAGSFYDPNSLTRDNEFIAPSEDFYYTDAISQNAVQFIENHEKDAPFFLYVPYTAAHWPMHAKPEDIAKYKGKFDEGWDVLREIKYEKMRELGILNSKWQLTEKDDIPDWENVERKAWYTSLMEVYAAMVDNMDQGIGRIVQMLEDKGIKDNTLIFFLQDNGACAEEFGFRESIGPYHKDVTSDALRPMGKDELQTEMVPKYTRDGRPVRSGIGLEPGGADTYLGYGKPWANASNTPFRMYKHWVHEGGIATPLIVHWPAGITAKNEFRNDPGHLIDIMATCIDVADAQYPNTFNGHNIIPLEGISLTPTFNAKGLEERAIFWEHEGNKAVRLGKYKLVSRWNKNAEYSWELYDLEADRSETNNLVDAMPDKANEMETLWLSWAKKVGVRSWDTKELIQ
ncbi:MAG: arylsulfatase [Bacteroidota bacterium]